METRDRNDLAKLLRTRRTATGLTVREVATRAGMVPSTVTRLEQGSIDSPRPDHLQRLGRVLGIDVEDLYGLAGYLLASGVPELQPYLRAKFGISGEEAAQLEDVVQALVSRWSDKEESSDAA